MRIEKTLLRILAISASMTMMFSSASPVTIYNNIQISAVTSADLSISQNGINFICDRESFHSTCYSDNTQSSIGYGTKCTGSAEQPHTSGSHSITKEQAYATMKSQIESTYSPKVRTQTTGVSMNQSQFDALVSLAYNCGGGTSRISNSPLVKYLNGELSEVEARAQYSEYIINKGTKYENGLRNRRNAEADLFFSEGSSSLPPVTPSEYYFPACTAVYSSIVEALKSIGADSSYSYRSKIASANNISNYSGTASQNTQMLSKLKSGKLIRPSAPVSVPVPEKDQPDPVKSYYSACNTSYTSIVEALKSINVDSSFSHRKKIASANGISNYAGSAEQNILMLTKLKSGTLINPDTPDVPSESPSSNRYFTACSASYTSIVEALKSINVDSSYSYRKKIASANSISNYSGSATQNVQMLNMLKSGTLINPDISVSVPAQPVPAAQPEPWYGSLTPANLGESFDGVILFKQTSKPISTYENDNVAVHQEQAMTCEMWRFTRLTDGSYSIINFKNGKALNAEASNGSNVNTYLNTEAPNQRWFIYQLNDGYILRSSDSEMVLDIMESTASDGTNVFMNSKNNTTSQIFNIYTNNVLNYGDLTENNITAAVGGTSDISLSWNSIKYADTYKVYRSYDNIYWEEIAQTSELSIKDSGLSPHTECFYKVETQNQFYLSVSSVVSATTDNFPHCTVTFYYDGGNISLKEKTVSYGSTYGDLPITQKDGWTFIGWFTSDGIKIETDTQAFLKENQTLYAHWEKNPTAVIYGDVNDDGYIDGKDSVLLLKKFVEPDNVIINEMNSDINRDGEVNEKDSDILLKYLAEWKDVVNDINNANAKTQN